MQAPPERGRPTKEGVGPLQGARVVHAWELGSRAWDSGTSGTGLELSGLILVPLPENSAVDSHLPLWAFP